MDSSTPQIESRPADVMPPSRFSWRDNKILLMVLLAIAIAITLVAIALRIYYVSGAAQLDLSRPEYETVREQVGVGIPKDTFSSTGVKDAKAYSEFDEKYTKQVQSLESLNVYGGESLSNQALGLPDISEN